MLQNIVLYVGNMGKSGINPIFVHKKGSPYLPGVSDCRKNYIANILQRDSLKGLTIAMTISIIPMRKSAMRG